MQAKFRGTCAACYGRILPGHAIVSAQGKWVHEQCASDDVPDVNPSAYGELCTSCFQYHRGLCA